jgi:ureidoacrylate peracid hydrolase
MTSEATSALLVVDPYNDFISEGGKFWPHVRAIAEHVGCVPNMLRVLDAARRAGLQILFAPHYRWRPGAYEGWKYWTPIQRQADEDRAFEDGTWGGTFREEFKPRAGEVVAQEHWCSSGFANTDLDLHLKKRGIHKLVVIGLIANTCIEATVRFAAELGYEVTVVKDATAALTWDEMKAALEVNLPRYAAAILTTNDLLHELVPDGQRGNPVRLH